MFCSCCFLSCGRKVVRSGCRSILSDRVCRRILLILYIFISYLAVSQGNSSGLWKAQIFQSGTGYFKHSFFLIFPGKGLVLLLNVWFKWIGIYLWFRLSLVFLQIFIDFSKNCFSYRTRYVNIAVWHYNWTSIKFLSFFSFQARHLYGLTIFENYLYAINSDNFNVLRINRYNSTDTQTLIRLEKAKEIHVYQKKTQPTGKLKILLYDVDLSWAILNHCVTALKLLKLLNQGFICPSYCWK